MKTVTVPVPRTWTSPKNSEMFVVSLAMTDQLFMSSGGCCWMVFIQGVPDSIGKDELAMAFMPVPVSSKRHMLLMSLLIKGKTNAEAAKALLRELGELQESNLMSGELGTVAFFLGLGTAKLEGVQEVSLCDHTTALWLEGPVITAKLENAPAN